MSDVLKTAEDAARVMADQTFDVLANSQGFFAATKYPFAHPVMYDNGVMLWPPVDIAPAAQIGAEVIIGRYTNIMGGVVIGARTRIQGFVFIPDGIVIGERVFIGPGVIFTNVKYPAVRESRRWRYDDHKDGRTVIEDGASIGAGAVICPGVRVGAGALIGAGAVVTRDVPADVVMVGCPAQPLSK